MAKSKDSILISYEGGNNELFWKKSAGLTGDRVDVLVPETHYAVAIKDGKYLDTLSGGRFTVSEKSRKTQASVDVVFMSKTHKLRILWGTKSRIVIAATKDTDGFLLGASGEYEVQISSPKHFYLELVGSDEVYDAAKLKERLQSKILSVIEHEMRITISAYKWEASTLPAHKQTLSESLQGSLTRMLELDYGLKLCSFLITNVVCDVQKSQKQKNEFILCSGCGVEMDASDNYCFNCGRKSLKDDADKVADDTNFCPRCGKKRDI